MNIIIICSDTFRHDHLGFLKKQPVQTPHLNQLATESACFSDYHLCSFPTLVNRIEVFSGRYAFPVFNWGKQPRQYPVMSEVFKHHGFTTALFADNLHLMHEGWEFGRGFDFVKDTPGQLHDPFQPPAAPMIDLPCPAEKLDVHGYRLERYRRNAYWYRQQKTSTTAALFRSAIDWLEKPAEKFFMWIDAFDPHEPWDAPDEFQKLYPLDKSVDQIIWPKNGYSKRFSEAELENMRRLYRAEVSQVDHWLGALIDRLRDRQILDNTVLVFCSDHGIYLGEHGLIGKPTLRRIPQPTLFYEELAHPPLLIRHPGGLGKGQTIPGLCQPADLFPTVLQLAGIAPVAWTQGRSLAPRLNGEPSPQRRAVGGSFPIKKNLVACLAVWTDEWCLMYDPFRGLEGSQLFHRLDDPAQQNNLLAVKPEIARQLYEQLIGWFDELGIPARRRQQLLSNAGFPRFPKLAYTLTLWKSQLFYWRHFRNYARKAQSDSDLQRRGPSKS